MEIEATVSWEELSALINSDKDILEKEVRTLIKTFEEKYQGAVRILPIFDDTAGITKLGYIVNATPLLK